MADKYTTPAFGIPDRFKTPDQLHQERMKTDGGSAGKQYKNNPWLPGDTFIATTAISTASSFFGALAGDAVIADYAFDTDITKDAVHSLKNISDKINEMKPAEAHAAGEKKFIHDDGTMGEAWSDLYAYADLAGSGIGSIAALVLGGGILKVAGKGAVKGAAHQALKKHTDEILASNKDVTREGAEAIAKKNAVDLAEKYDSAIGTAAYGTAEGAIVSGSVGMSIEEEVMRAPAEVINTAPRFQALYYEIKDNSNVTHDEAHNIARIKLAREAGIEGAKTVAIPAIMLGAVAGRYIDKAISGRLTQSTLANFAILEGVEIPTEMAQGATEQYVQNKVYKDIVDKTRNVWAGVPDAAVREGLGVAFAVAPLSAIRAKAETKMAEGGGPPSADDYTDNEILSLMDEAAKIDEVATVELMNRTAEDPEARFNGLVDIIAKGNATAEEPAIEPEPEIDLDLDLDEEVAQELEDEALTGDLTEEGSPFEDDASATTDVVDVETPVEDTQTRTGEAIDTPQAALDENATEEIEPTGWATATANEVSTKRPEFGGLILSYKPGDDRNGRESAHYYGEFDGTEDFDGDPLDMILNKDYNADEETPVFVVNQLDWDTQDFRQHKVMGGFKTAEEAKQGYIDQFDEKGFGSIRELTPDEFTEWKSVPENLLTEIKADDVPPTEAPPEPEETPPATPKGDPAAGGAAEPIPEPVSEPAAPVAEETPVAGEPDQAEVKKIAKALGIKTMTSKADLAQRVKDVLEFAKNPTAEGLAKINGFMKTPFDLNDVQGAADTINGVPPSDDTTPTNERTGEEVKNPPEEKPVEEQPTEPEAPDTGEEETSEPSEGDGDADAVPEDRITEGDADSSPVEPTPEEQAAALAEQQAADEARIANREAIDLVLNELEPEMKIVVYGTTISTGREMNPETIEYVEHSKDGKRKFKRGRDFKFLVLEKGDYYVQSISGNKSKLVTKIERKKRIMTDEDGGNVGGTLRRPHEIWPKDKKEFTDAEEAMKKIKLVTSPAKYLNTVNYSGKTFGVKRLYSSINGHIPTFTKWLAPHIGSEHGGPSPNEAMLAVLNNNPLTQFSSDKQFNVQTPEELYALVDQYVEMMTGIQSIVDGAKTIKELRDGFANHEFSNEPPAAIQDILALTDVEYEQKLKAVFREYGAARIEARKAVTPVAKQEDSFRWQYPSMMAEITYNQLFNDYKEQIANENVSDEKLVQHVTRERRKLSVLAAMRDGMPEHREGDRDVSADEVVDTFGFLGLTYGGWVSDTYLEGERSEKQQYRNLVYDAFSDLAYLTGLPLKAMGNGLYLSLGALGQGKATGAAFFGPNETLVDLHDKETESNKVYLRELLDDNLVEYTLEEDAKALLKKVEKVMTRDDVKIRGVRVLHFNREEGDGAFAHEWAHNLGDKLKTLENSVALSLQRRVSAFGLHRYVQRKIKAYIRHETGEDEEDLIQSLRNDIEHSTSKYNTDFDRPTNYLKGSKYMDVQTGGHSGKQYWATPHEMFARATEAYIWDALTGEGDGAANPFLQNRKAADGAMSPDTGYAANVYPSEEERQYFNGILKQMFEQTEVDEDGNVSFPTDDEGNIQFGNQAEFKAVRERYISNLDTIIDDAREARIDWVDNNVEPEGLEPYDGMSDEDFDDIFDNLGKEKPDEGPEFVEKGEKTGGDTAGKKRPPKEGYEGGKGLGGPKPVVKTPKDIIEGMGKTFKISEKGKSLIERMLNAPGAGSENTRFSIKVEDFNDTRFSVSTVGDRNPDIDPALYGEWVEWLSDLYSQFRDAGNRNLKDFSRLLEENFGPKGAEQAKPYVLQFMRDMRDGHINYRDYLDASAVGSDSAGEGANDGSGSIGQDDGSGVQQPADGQTADPDADGAAATGDTGTSPDGARSDGSANLDNAGGDATTTESPEALSERIQKETGLRSPSVEPLPSNLGITSAQVKKVPVARRRDTENDYQVPTSMSENMQNSVLRLSEVVQGMGYDDLDDYVMKQLGYTKQSEFNDAYMSLQVEAIAAAIYQMNERHRSVIIADQTGVGKGRQAGGLIRWAIKEGKIPVFVTENDSLYTDMYYDMADSSTDNVVPFITNTGVGIKSREIDEDEAAEIEHQGGKVPTLHKLPNKTTVGAIKTMAENGLMPAGANAIFTSYSQMNQAGPRRNALMKLAEKNDIVLILDESHKAAKFDPKKGRINRNEYFTGLIKESWGTTYLSATFAKDPNNLGFYFNTDLADAMDGMKQLVDILSAGGVRLQEVMSRALTRNGQLFRREISYDDIEIKVEFDDSKKERDKDYIDRINDVIQDLIPANNAIYADLQAEYAKDPAGVAAILRARQEITETEYARISEGIANDKRIKVNFTRISDQIHNLVDQILVASKADLAVDKMIEQLERDEKPIVGLDKTNAAMLNEYITRSAKEIGDDMSDMNWGNLMEFWAKKSFNVSITVGEITKESDRIRGNMGDSIEGVSEEAINNLNVAVGRGKTLLKDIDLPLSPVDYIAQKTMARAQKELGKNVNIKEITGRYSGDYGIDYSEGKKRLFKVDRFQKRDIIDAFNGEVKDANGEKLPSTIDGLVINQSGSTGVSLHSSMKHGDRKIRHMTIIEPAGDINVFQQMLGRIFRTGMGDTYPLYTVLASAIPTDARKINILLKKMESLNAQTSSNREGAATLDIPDIMNAYGDDVVETWVEGNPEFQELFPQWEGKKQHDRGLAYWVTGKVSLFPFDWQAQFYSEVSTMYNESVEQAKADGTFTLEEKFYEWNARYLEEIVIAEPRGDGTGFNSGSYLVKLDADSAFRAMTAADIVAKIDESPTDPGPNAEKFDAIKDITEKLKESTLEEIAALAPEEEAAKDASTTRLFNRYRESLLQLYEFSLVELLGADKHQISTGIARRPTDGRVESLRETLKDMEIEVVRNLPKGTKTKFQDLMRSVNRTVKSANLKVKQEAALDRFELGKTYSITVGEGDTRMNTIGTVVTINRLNNSVDPHTLGDIEIEIAVNRPGGSDDNGIMKRSLGQTLGMSLDPVREYRWGDGDQAEILKKYHETLAETSATTEEWVVIGNPLIAASEIVPQNAEYMQFSDSYGRRMFGIKMPKAAVKQGIEGMLKGNLEIPSEKGGTIITDYIKDNPHSRLAREFGFRTRGGNVVVLYDNLNDNGVRIKFDAETASEKATDPILAKMVEISSGNTTEFEEETIITVPFADAPPIINQVMRRSRLVVPGSMKPLLKNYMNIADSTKAGENQVVTVHPSEVQTYVFEYGNKKIVAHRGTYLTKSQAAKNQPPYDGFYMEGLGDMPWRWSVNNIARLTMMKGNGKETNGGDEHKGRQFLQIDEFIRGNVQNGFNGATGLGKPLFDKSVKTDGTSFRLALTSDRRVTKEAAEAALDGLPKRLARLVKVVDNEEQLPIPVKVKIANRGLQGRVNGVYHEGRIYIVSSALSTPDQASIVFLHEAIGHFGIRKLMGEDLNSLLDEVAAAYPEQMDALAEQYRVDTSTDAGFYEIAEEVLAHMAEQDINPNLWRRIVAAIRNMARKIGFQINLSDNDVRAILLAARTTIENGGIDAGGAISQPEPMFSVGVSTADQTGSTPIPEDTVKQALVDGQPVDAVFRAVWGAAELTQIPNLVRYTSAQSLRGAMNFYDNHMGWAHASFEYMAKGLIDQYKLDSEYKQLKASTSSMKAGIIDEVQDILRELGELEVSDEDSKKIHEILTREVPREDVWDAVTEPIRERIEILGQKAVDLNLISQESYDTNKGMYLHRVYMKYEQNRSGLDKFADSISGRKKKIKGDETKLRGLSYPVAISRILEDTGLTEADLIVEGEGATIYKISNMSDNGQKAIKVTYSLSPMEADNIKSEEFKVRAKHKGRVIIWRDWTKAEREDMGQITDARYVLGKTYSLLAHDLSTGEFFQRISENPAWTLPVEEEGDHDVASGERSLRGGVVTGADWVRVPDSKISKSQAKVYGALAGRVVRAEIFQDLNQLSNMQKASIWKTIMTSFKLNKTARNPVVHFNNIMSNIVLMDMADVRFSDLYRALVEMRKKGAVYQEAKRNGALGVSFAEKELQNEVLDKILAEIHASIGAAPVGLEQVALSFDNMPLNKQFAFMMKMLDRLWGGVDTKGKPTGLRGLDKKMLNYYQHEDEVFRIATYMRRRAQGMSEVEAGISARDQFLNYDINAPWINALRATVLPFISYTYRAVPIVAKSIMQRPWKMAKYFTIAYGMNALGYALSGGDEDKERRSLRDEASGMLWIGSERMIRMGWNDDEGDPYFWDVRRLIPVGDVFDMNQYHAALPIIPASVMPSGPIAMGFEFVLNKTGFFGEEIVDPLADDWVLGTEKTLDWAWKSYGPSAPWIPYSYYWDKIGIATTGGRDRLGREYDILPALASSFGIKIAPQDVDYGIALKAMTIERTVEAVRHQLNFLEKDYWQRKISKSSYEATRERYYKRLRHLEKKARELLGRD